MRGSYLIPISWSAAASWSQVSGAPSENEAWAWRLVCSRNSLTLPALPHPTTGLPPMRQLRSWAATGGLHPLQPEPWFQKRQKLTVSLGFAFVVLSSSLRFRFSPSSLISNLQRLKLLFSQELLEPRSFSKVYSLSFYFWNCFFIYSIHLLFHCSPFPYWYFRILYINKSFIWHMSDKICHMWSLFFNSVYGLLLWYLLHISLSSSVFSNVNIITIFEFDIMLINISTTPSFKICLSIFFSVFTILCFLFI